MRALQKSDLIAAPLGEALLAASSTFAAAQTKVTMHLDFLVNGYHAPFYLAKEKGWVQNADADVIIEPGKGRRIQSRPLAPTMRIRIS